MHIALKNFWKRPGSGEGLRENVITVADILLSGSGTGQHEVRWHTNAP